MLRPLSPKQSDLGNRIRVILKLDSNKTDEELNRHIMQCNQLFNFLMYKDQNSLKESVMLWQPIMS